MKVVPNRYQKIEIAGYFVIISFFLIELIIQCGIDILKVAAIPFSILTLLALRNTFAKAKTCEYTKEGCIISFLFYKKVYTWKDILSRKYESYLVYDLSGISIKTGGLLFAGSWIPVEGGVFFSTHPYHKPEKMSPDFFCDLIHPFSSFYVLFPLGDIPLNGKTVKPREYQFSVDKDRFLGLLKEWGVEIEGLE